ncbi:MAG: GHKL domain-containing protein [Faecalibacterium sp.]|nr:GHKL domain-containing protein [Faecalibacterium sp.]
MSTIALANYAMDLLFAMLYFQHSEQPYFPLRRRLLGFAFLMATWILYPSGKFLFLSNMMQRYFLRIVLTLLCVLVSFPIRWSSAVYAVGYWCTLHLLVQSLFFAPFTYGLFQGTAVFTGKPTVDLLLCITLTFAVKGLCFGGFTLLTPLLRVGPVQLPDMIPIALVAVVALYGRELAIPLTHSHPSSSAEISNYYLLLQVSLIALLGYMEFSRRGRRENAAMQLQKQVADALLSGVENQRQNMKALAALNHDLKNHLISLQLLLHEGNQQEADRYIAQLLEQNKAAKRRYSTGSELVDGLLSMKLDGAEARGVDVKVSLDISPGSFLSNHDLCILFGNAIDNALEACEKLPPQRSPYIHISGGQRANALILRFENACANKAVLINGLPLTGKENLMFHGFGLRNVSEMLKKYDGHLSIDKNDEGKFALTVLIPLP